MRKIRGQRSPFGLSLLDLLCCAFGATILLIVLNQREAESQLARSQDQLTAANADRAQALAEKQVAVDRATRMRKLAGLKGGLPSSLSRLQFLPDIGARRVVVVLDVSGSMGSYFENAPHSGEFPKWRQAENVVTQLLMQQSDLKRFAVIALDDGRSESTQSARIFPRDSVWADAEGERGLDQIAAAAGAIRATVPAGGSDHTRALTRIVEQYVLLAQIPADAIVLVTDGLPNVIAGAIPSPPSLTPPSRKRELATRCLHELAAAMEKLPADRHAALRLHVVCLEWPDDAELANFGLSLAAAGQGYFVYLSPEEDPGG